MYNAEFIKKVEQASQCGAFGTLEGLLEEYSATRTVIKTLPNGIQTVQYHDKDGQLLAEVHEVDSSKK